MSLESKLCDLSKFRRLQSGIRLPRGASMVPHLILLGVISALAMSCGSSQPASQTRGHFENSSADLLEGFKGQQSVIPEYQSNELIVSLPLIKDYGKADIVGAALDAGTKKVFIVAPNGVKKTSPSLRGLANLLGERMDQVEIATRVRYTMVSVWSRDWSPLQSKTADGDLRLLDFNYYNERPYDDQTSQDLEVSLNRKRISLPIYNEGGNFMSDSDGYCFMADGILTANGRHQVTTDLVLSKDDLIAAFKDYAGCQFVGIMPRLPFEGTGHIDMWAKIINSSTVVLSDLSDQSIAKVVSTSDRQKALLIQSFLRLRQQEFRQLGYTVVTIPMPSPNPSADLFRSYTNGLIVDHTYIAPRYVMGVDVNETAYAYPDADLLEDYETKVEQVFTDLGFAVKWIETDELIRDGGAVHCVTMQL